MVGIIGSVYGLWLLYAAGLNLFMTACLVYAVSIPMYVISARQHRPGQPVFIRSEWIVLGVVVLLALLGAVYLIM